MDGTEAGRPGSARRMAGRSKAMLAIAFAAAAVIVAIVVVTTASGQAKTGQPPAAARNFTLDALGKPGRTVSLAALAGQPVIINFFASWCTPCKHETPLLARFYQAHHGSVLVIGVDSNDQTAAALKFVTAEGVRYPVAADPFPARITVSYGVLALPQTFFLDAQHKIVRHIVGELTMAELSSWADGLTSRGPG
jgi:cytochrome c biogenesis protein CcmG, thiol:disulfide interchange protein DsbE